MKRQILPGIAAYETLQAVLPKDEALQTVHSYVEQLAKNAHRSLSALLRVPGLYRLFPGVFVKSTRTVFGPAAGFALTELQTGRGIWRIDMTKCPYHDTCVQHGCPELCPCFSRQRRYQLRWPAPEAPLAPHHNIGPRRRPLRLLPENSEITAGGISTWRSNNLAIHRESV